MGPGEPARGRVFPHPEDCTPSDRDKGLVVLLPVVLTLPAAASGFSDWIFSAVGVPFLVVLTLVTSLAGLPAAIYYARRKELPALGQIAVVADITVNGLTAFWYLLVLPWLNEMALTAWKRLGPMDAQVVVWLGFALVVSLLSLKLWLFRAGGRPFQLPAMKYQRVECRWEIEPEIKRELTRFAVAVVGWVLLITLLRAADERHGWPELTAWLGVIFGGGFLGRLVVRVRGHGLRIGLLWGLLAGSIATEVHEFDRLGRMASYDILGVSCVLLFSVAWNGLLAFAVERYFWPRPVPDGHEASLGPVAK